MKAPFLNRWVVLLLSILLFSGPVFCASVLASETEEKPKAEGKADADKKDEKKDEKDGKKKEEIEDVSGGKFEGDPVYIHMRPLVLPMITRKGAEQLITLLVDLQTKDYETAMGMHTTMPRLKDSILRVLYKGISDGSLRDGSSLNLDAIKNAIKNAVNHAYTEDSIVTVLIQGVSQRQLGG